MHTIWTCPLDAGRSARCLALCGRFAVRAHAVLRNITMSRRMKLEDLPASVVEFKREVYVEVAKDFVPLIEELKRSGKLARNV